MKIVLVTQSFGREYEYKRALFCILSAFAQIPQNSWNQVVVALHTDAPHFFKKHLQSFDVHYFPMDEEKIRNMRGNIDFLHRMKIALIEESFDAFPDHILLYTDSDTFFLRNPLDFIEIKSEKDLYMHTDEYPFSELNKPEYESGNPFRLYFEQVVNHEFQLVDQSVFIAETLHSLNAGVMCFHPEHRKLLPDVYSLTDQTYPLTANHAAEQYAFSIISQLVTQVKFIENEQVFHYWHRVQKEYMDQILTANSWLFSDIPIREKLDKIRALLIKLPRKVRFNYRVFLDNAIQDWNNNHWIKGNKNFLIACIKKPTVFFPNFRHFLYHTKRIILKK